MSNKITIAGVEYEKTGRLIGSAPHVFHGEMLYRKARSWYDDGTAVLGAARYNLVLPPNPAEQWEKALKPLWAYFPEAQWAAMDMHNHVRFFSEKPIQLKTAWGEAASVEVFRSTTLSAIPIDWRESLRKRPEGV